MLIPVNGGITIWSRWGFAEDWAQSHGWRRGPNDDARYAGFRASLRLMLFLPFGEDE